MPFLINGQKTLAEQLIKIISKKVGNIFYKTWGFFFVTIKLSAVLRTLKATVFALFL
jgi:hypothetical protein